MVRLLLTPLTFSLGGVAGTQTLYIQCAGLSCVYLGAAIPVCAAT